MAGYGSKQVSVGALVKPEDALSNTLFSIGESQGKKAHDKKLLAAKEKDRLDRLAIQEEDTRRYGLNQNRLDRAELENRNRYDTAQEAIRKEALFVDNTRKAQQDLGTYITNGGVKNHKYRLDENRTHIQDRLNSTIAKLNTGKEAFKSYFSGDSSPQSLETALKAFDDNYTGGGTKAEILDARNQRAVDYAELSTQLRLTKDPAARKALVDNMAEQMYGTPLKQIQKDIDTGKYLLKGEKENSVLRGLSPNIAKYIKRSDILKEVSGNVHGQTRDELMSRERQITGDVNLSGMAALKAKTATYSAAIKKAGEFKSSDLANMTKSLEGVDIGWLDNPKVLAAANDMLDSGIHPAAITQAIFSNMDSNIAGTSFITKDGDKKLYDSMMTRAKGLSDSLKGTAGGTPSAPGNYNPRADRTVDQILDSMYQARSTGRLNQYLPKVDRQKVLDESLFPTEASTRVKHVPTVRDDGTTVVKGIERVPLTVGNFDVPGSDDWLANEKVQNQRRLDREAYLNSRTVFDEVNGVSEAVIATAGAIPGKVGEFAGSVMDIGNEITGKAPRNYRDSFSDAMTVGQLDENSSPEAIRNMKFVSDKVKWLPPSIVPKGISTPLNGGFNQRALFRQKAYNKAVNKAVKKNSANAKVEADYKKYVDELDAANNPARKSTPADVLTPREKAVKDAATDMFNRQKAGETTRAENVKIAKVASGNWAYKKMNLEKRVRDGKAGAKEALAKHLKSKPKYRLPPINDF